MLFFFIYIINIAASISLNNCNLALSNLLTETIYQDRVQQDKIYFTKILSDRLKYEPEIINIVSRDLMLFKKYILPINRYSLDDKLNIISMLSRIKDFNPSVILRRTIRHENPNYTDIDIWLAKYKAKFLEPLKSTKAGDKNFEDLISLRQGNKFDESESIVYLQTLYKIIIRVLSKAKSLDIFVKTVGKNMQNLMKTNPFIGIKNSRQRVGLLRNDTERLFLVANSHLEPYTQLFLYYLRSAQYVFNGAIYKDKHEISLENLSFNNKQYSINDIDNNIDISKTPEFNILITRANFLRELFKDFIDLVRKNYIPYSFSIDLDEIHSTLLPASSIVNFYTETENQLILVYPSPEALLSVIKLLNNDYTRFRFLYTKKRLTISEQQEFLDLGTSLSYYLSKYVPYYRGSSGFARIIFAITIEKINKKFPDLKTELLDLDAFTMNKDTYLKKYKNIFYITSRPR